MCCFMGSSLYSNTPTLQTDTVSVGCSSTEPTITDWSAVILRSAVRLPNQISFVFNALSFRRRDAIIRWVVQQFGFCFVATCHIKLFVVSKQMKVDGVLVEKFSIVFSRVRRWTEDRALRHTTVHCYVIRVAVGGRERLSPPPRQLWHKPAHCQLLNDDEPVTKDLQQTIVVDTVERWTDVQ